VRLARYGPLSPWAGSILFDGEPVTRSLPDPIGCLRLVAAVFGEWDLNGAATIAQGGHLRVPSWWASRSWGPGL
jgi:hypothetical protein